MKALLVTAAAVGLLASTPAFASAGAPANANATADAVIVQPIAIQKVTDLNFGRIAADSNAGTVTVDNSGNRTSSNPPSLLIGGTAPSAATFTVSGEPNLAYTASLTSSTISLTGAGTMSAALTLQQAGPSLNGSGASSVSVGGVLSVGANQAAGTYQGTMTVNVSYD